MTDADDYDVARSLTYFSNLLFFSFWFSLSTQVAEEEDSSEFCAFFQHKGKKYDEKKSFQFFVPRPLSSNLRVVIAA